MELKAHKINSIYKGKPNIADWRSQDLGSKGQYNCLIPSWITVGLSSCGG